MEHIDIGHPDACELVSHAIQRLTLSFTFSSISFRWLRLDGRANTRTLLAHCGPALTSLSLNLSAFYNDDKGEGANVPDFGVRHCPNLARVALGLADPLESWGVLKRVLVQLFAAGERTRCIELQLALPPSALAHVGAFDEVLAPYVPERVGTVRILAKLSAGNAEAGALEAVARPLSGWEQEIVRERLPSVSKGVLCF
ncbi:hypothetical protein PsYK624_103350 [Phanerochaete sordida]|uniref:Uncharacterized protein n=1 Tax=Phanerochaete sordida TaxID=48140 RepID=A0A9P3LHI2_9APHY|nr:hypothetical protein PsYK624_103350 [Phanerochaete sordida]